MAKAEKTRFVFMTKKYIRKNHIQLTDYQFAQLQGMHPKGIFWIQTVPGGIVHFNWTLLQSYLLHGDTPAFRDLVEEYMSTIPQAA